jgi:Tfp pilus assembly protein PilO
MSNLSYRHKIYITSIILVALALVFFWLVFPRVQKSNAAISGKLFERNKEYQVLLSEQRSFEQGKRDLASFESKPYKPDQLFSRDTSLVNEIKTLEERSSALGLNFVMNVSGTAESAPKVPGTQGSIYNIPYTATVTGSFDNIVTFINYMEHLPFITHTKVLTFTAQSEGGLKATLSANFFIKR